MKRLHLLVLSSFFSVASQAAVIVGHAFTGGGAPIAGLVVHARDTSCGAVWDLTGTTDAAGMYSITIPSTVCLESLWYISGTECTETITSVHYYIGETIEANLTFCPADPASGSGCDTIWGHAYLGATTDTAAYPAKVWLIKKTWEASTETWYLTAIDSTETYPSGEYVFNCVPSPVGDLMVKVALAGASPYYADYLPTYHYSSLTWNLADPLALGAPGNDVHLQAGENPGGPGFISGDVLEGAGKGTSVGDPIGNVEIILTTDMNVPVAYTYSDASGNFSFSGLAYGTYKIFGDAWSRDNYPLTVTISAATPGIDNVLFETHSTWFAAHTTTGIGNVSPNLAHIIAGPNPAKDVLTISGMDQISGEKTITVRNVTGQVLAVQSTEDGPLGIPVNNFPAGIYFFQVKTSEGSVDFRIVK